MVDNFITMELINKLKSALGIVASPKTEFEEVFQNSLKDQELISEHFYSITLSKITTYTEIVKKWDDSKKVEFMIFLFKIIEQTTNSWKSHSDPNYKKNLIANEYIQTLFKSKMMFSEESLITIYAAFKENKHKNMGMMAWPLSNYFKQIEFNYKGKVLPISIKNILEDIISTEKDKHSYYYKSRIKLYEKIKDFLYSSMHSDNETRPTYFMGKDEFSGFANALIDKQDNKGLWYLLVAQAQKANGGKPSKKYLSEVKTIIDELGHEKFKNLSQEWFSFVTHLNESVRTHTNVYDNREYTYNTVEFLDSFNSDALKGFVWMSSWFYDSNTIQTISKLAERSFKKIPQKGPAAAALGNACLYTLFASKGLDGIAQLSKLKLKVKQTSTATLIDKYINDAAKKMGISPAEIEDLAVDDFKLQDCKLTTVFEDFTCILELTGIGKSTLKWFKKDGSEQKTVPKLVKEKFSEKLKKLKAKQKQIDQTTVVQKGRFDRMLRANRVLKMEYFQEKYVNHELFNFIISKVIFNFTNEHEAKLAIYINKQWIGLDYKKVEIDNYTHVSLWHPVNSSTNEVKEWRQFLMDSEIQQPFKQAYREIYLLTDAEVNTRTYSNRMASHILKQHQYVMLAKGRNWKAQLIGAWDGGDQDTAVLLLPEYNLKVEYWVNALNVDNQFNDTGIWTYVTTDQIRFVNSETNELLELVNIPPVAFSEAMRDVDLFVGVASVGNDPTWSDSGGLPAYRDYWQSYSFGDLSEIAKNRKEILTGLIPRLKIASVTHIEDKFVVVKGKKRTYKIHIGSTNILMEPNDQYLCIVPDRSMKNETTNLFLPFEGDNGLSVIISKAFLLANDDKITDSTIISQINR